MQLFLLGCDDETLALLQGWTAKPGHSLAAAFECGKWAAAVRAAAPGVTLRDDWESLLVEGRSGVVLVTTSFDRERRGEQFRRLVQERIAVWAVHPACESIVGYELEMIGRDSPTPLVPYVPGSRHPAMAWLHEAIHRPSSERLGPVSSISLVRDLPDTRPAVVERQLARDLYHLRALLGEVEQLGAFGPTVETPNWAQLHVHVANAAGGSARWSAAPAATFGGRLEVVGERGRAVLHLPADPREWRLELLVSGQTQHPVAGAWEEASAAWQLFERAAAGQPVPPTWSAACRASELAESVRESLDRGRTLAVYETEHSEEKSFKGVMAIGGCGLLLFVVAVLVVVATVEGLKLPLAAWPVWKLWPFALVGGLFVFLAAQLIALLFQPKPPPRDEKLKPIQ